MAVTALLNLSDANAGWGTIAYNGFTFPGSRDVKLTGEYVYDRSGRTVTHTRYVLRVHGTITDADASAHETKMFGFRQKLQEAGQVLTLTDQGLGDIVINGAEGIADCEWGPKPRLAELTQVGGVCTEYTWECSFSIKETLGTRGPILAFCYSVEFDYDDAGLCTRTISGYLQIGLTRQNGQRSVVASADAYQNQLRVGVPHGMRRGPRRFKVSEDRSTLDFTFTDLQLDAEAPPAGVLKAELDYEIENIPPGFARYAASLSGPIEVPAGTPTIRAAETFVRIMLDKFSKLKKAAGSKGVVIPMRVRFGRTLGTRQSHFAFGWMVSGCLDDLLKEGGIWEPISGSSWESWKQSMEQSGAWNNRGTSNLVYNAAEDAIIDMGIVRSLPVIGTGGQAPASSSESGSHVFKIEGVSKENSWLAYENGLEAYREAQEAAHHIVQPWVPAAQSGEEDSPTDVGVRLSPVIALKPPIIQQQGPPVDMILMTGKCLRVGFKPAVPRLLTIGGKKVHEVRVRTDGPRAIACFFGQPIYVARWAILYRVVDGYLSEIPARKNPALCCEATT